MQFLFFKTNLYNFNHKIQWDYLMGFHLKFEIIHIFPLKIDQLIRKRIVPTYF